MTSCCVMFASSCGNVTGSNESVVMQQPVVNIDRYGIVCIHCMYVVRDITSLVL